MVASNLIHIGVTLRYYIGYIGVIFGLYCSEFMVQGLGSASFEPYTLSLATRQSTTTSREPTLLAACFESNRAWDLGVRVYITQGTV